MVARRAKSSEMVDAALALAELDALATAGVTAAEAMQLAGYRTTGGGWRDDMRRGRVALRMLMALRGVRADLGVAAPSAPPPAPQFTID